MESPQPKLDFSSRASGLLLHPTSLPSRYFSGDVGPEAYRFVDFLRSAGQRWWQMLPVGPPGTGPGYSPYSSFSALAGNPWLISLETLVEQGWLDRADLTRAGGANAKRVDFTASIRYREPRLRKAFDRFAAPQGGQRAEFDEYRDANLAWLDDFALFSALKDAYPGRTWLDWDRGVRLRLPADLDSARRTLAREIKFHQFVQFAFDRQWRDLRAYCTSRNVGLIGDIPIFVALDSVDVWANKDLFVLDKSGRPTIVTGCPPDAFACDGQLWGHPHYKWPAHRDTAYAWWVARFAACMKYFDAVRIDHFLGFQRAWSVPARATSAKRGRWLPGPQDELFHAVRAALGDIPIIAEDLGSVTPEALALRDRLHLPGMKVLQFGLTGDDAQLPHNYTPHCVAYTGTHDNPTTAGWFKSLKKRDRDKVLTYCGGTPATAHRDMIRTLMTSVANTVIFPVQDVLGLGNDARMNVPGVAEGNWNWRLHPDHLTPALAHRLQLITESTGRT
jgi:4-alpha-glucanotransferase